MRNSKRGRCVAQRPRSSLSKNYCFPILCKVSEAGVGADASVRPMSSREFPQHSVGADAGHSRSRRRSVTDVGLPLAGTHRPGRMHRFYGNLWRICNFSMGRQSRRPLQQPFALSVGADDSVRPQDVPILRESSANSQLPNGAMCASPPTSKEVTACGFAANSRRNSLHSAGRSRAPPLPTAVAFQRFLRKTNRLWS